MLSGCGGEEAERKRLELQRAVDDLLFEARPGTPLPLAISVGAAIFPHDGDIVRSAAGHGRQPDVSRQDAPQARSPAATASHAGRGRRRAATSPTRELQTRRPSEFSRSHRSSTSESLNSASDVSALASALRHPPSRARVRSARSRAARRRWRRRPGQPVDPPGVESAAELDPGGGHGQRQHRPRSPSGAPADETQEHAPRARRQGHLR